MTTNAPTAASHVGYVHSPVRHPYPAIVLAQPPLFGRPNGHVTVIGAVSLGSSVVQLQCLYPNGQDGLVPMGSIYDPGELPDVLVMPLRRASSPAPSAA